jgi:aldehyde:ferredoxin oxidoreductase
LRFTAISSSGTNAGARAGTTGLQLTQPQLADLANEITQASRAYNRREGLGAAADTLPPALFKANREGAMLTPAELSAMIDEYNEIREGRAKKR